jgi:hypothetical protein
MSTIHGRNLISNCIFSHESKNKMLSCQPLCFLFLFIYVFFLQTFTPRVNSKWPPKSAGNALLCPWFKCRALSKSSEVCNGLRGLKWVQTCIAWDCEVWCVVLFLLVIVLSVLQYTDSDIKFEAFFFSNKNIPHPPKVKWSNTEYSIK